MTQGFIRDKRVFISYRRSETRWVANSIYRELTKTYELQEKDIFKDTQRIITGDGWFQTIQSNIANADIVLVLMGPRFASLTRDGFDTPRIHEEDDVVRFEIAEALRQDKKVIPILIDGAGMPSEADLPPDLKQLPSIHASQLAEERSETDLKKILEESGILMYRPSEIYYERIRRIVGLISTLIFFILAYKLIQYFSNS